MLAHRFCNPLVAALAWVSPSFLGFSHSRFEFDDLFETFHYESVRRKILDRQLKRCHFTTVLWRIFLHCFPTDANRWSDTLQASRHKYDELVNSYDFQPNKRTQANDTHAHNLNHPLSREEQVSVGRSRAEWDPLKISPMLQSPWFQYYQYEELKDTIDQDVKRTSVLSVELRRLSERAFHS